MCGLALAGALLFLNWTGAPIYVIVFAMALTAARFAARGQDPLVRPFLARSAVSLTVCAALLAAAYLAAYGLTRVVTIASGIPSGFQPLFLLGAALYAGALATFPPGGGNALRRPLFMTAAAGLAVVAAIIAKSLWHGFSCYLLTGNRPMMSISECRSPFIDMHSGCGVPRSGGACSLAPFQPFSAV